MTFMFKPAVREQTPLLIGLGGQSGSGKTYSALLLASGLSDRIAVVDTERGRALHYAEGFRFDHGTLEPPFTPERYLEAILAAEEHVGSGGVVVVDSMSHEWEGVGGLLESAAAAADAMAKRSGGYPEAYTFPSWREPKQRHQKLVNRLLQLRCHLICCFRAKEKLKLVEVEEKGRTKKKPVSQGILPIMEENLPYEMTLFAILHADRPGVPHWTHKALMEALRPLFPDGQPLSRAHGERLARWSAGGQARPQAQETDMPLYRVLDEKGEAQHSTTDLAEALRRYGQVKAARADKLGVAVANLGLLRTIAASAKGENLKRLRQEIEAAEAAAEAAADSAPEVEAAEPDEFLAEPEEGARDEALL